MKPPLRVIKNRFIVRESRLVQRAIALGTMLTCTGLGWGQSTERVSVTSGGMEGNGASDWASISGDGRYVAFSSYASNLVANDNNGDYDVFLHDRVTGELQHVNLRSDGTASNSGASGCNISDDGRYIAFYSAATNMTAQGASGAFVKDRITGTTTYLSVNALGQAGTSPPIQWGFYGRIAMSTTGRYVAFESDRNGLVAGDNNNTLDVYVHDRDADGNGVFDEPGGIGIVRVSVNAAGQGGGSYSHLPTMSANGRFVVFTSNATNLVPNDSNGVRDVFLHDRDADGNGVFDESGGTSIERINVASGGGQASGGDSPTGSVSSDGRFVVFYSHAMNLVMGDTNAAPDVFIRDRLLDLTARISLNMMGQQCAGASTFPEFSPDNRYISFITTATDMFPNDGNNGPDLVVHDRFTRVTRLLNVNSAGQQASSLGSPFQSWVGRFSGSARYVGMTSAAGDVVPGDANGVSDVFVRDRGPNYAYDINGDGIINIDDLVGAITTWGNCPAVPLSCAADLDGSGAVNIDDLVVVIAHWGG